MYLSELLRALKSSKYRVDKLLEDLREIEVRAASVKAVTHDEPRVKGSGYRKDISDAIIKHDNIYTRYLKEAGKWIKLYDLADEGLDALSADGIINSTEYLVLRYRYMLDMRWEDVRDRLDFTDASYCMRIHKQALEKVDSVGDFVHDV